MRRFAAGGLLVAALMLTACAGMQARSGSMQVIANAYATIVRPIVAVGIGAELDAGRIDEAKAAQLNTALSMLGDVLDGGQVAEVGSARAAWDMLLPFALQGIDSRVEKGEIGPGVGAALKETIRLFGARLLQLEGPQ